MIFLLSESEWTIIILAISVVPIVVLMGYALFTTIRKKKEQAASRREEIEKSEDSTQQEYFFYLYGGKENIINVNKELSRISVQVHNIDKVLVEEIKETGAKGILLVNDVIKCSFGDRAPYIYKLLTNKESQE